MLVRSPPLRYHSIDCGHELVQRHGFSAIELCRYTRVADLEYAEGRHDVDPITLFGCREYFQALKIQFLEFGNADVPLGRRPLIIFNPSATVQDDLQRTCWRLKLLSHPVEADVKHYVAWHGAADPIKAAVMQNAPDAHIHPARVL